MKGVAFCNKGIEDVSCLEIKELINCKGEAKEEYVLFDYSKEEELCKLSYLMQSCSKVGKVIKEFSFKKQEEIYFEEIKHDIPKDRSFKISCKIKNSKIADEDIKVGLGEKIDRKVDLENPDYIIYVYINGNNCLICSDFSGIDLGKRSYRVFSSPRNVKSTIAYAMVRISDYSKGEIFVDPFCLTGSVVIEASLFRNKFPVRFYDKEDLLFSNFVEFDFSKIDSLKESKNNIYGFDSQFKNVDFTKKNAKIAGINKALSLSKVGVEWLETKFKENEVMRIVTCIPNISKNVNKDKIIQLYKEFFYQAEFVLNEEGRIVLLCTHPEIVKDECREFKIEIEKEVWQGQEKYYILKLKK